MDTYFGNVILIHLLSIYIVNNKILKVRVILVNSMLIKCFYEAKYLHYKSQNSNIYCTSIFFCVSIFISIFFNMLLAYFRYPLYQRGNPQLRVYLPNFWMKLVKPEFRLKKNVVHFHCSMEMTRHDIKNYLEKIYNVPVVKVDTRIALGKTRRVTGYIVKDDDIKMAYVHLVRN